MPIPLVEVPNNKIELVRSLNPIVAPESATILYLAWGERVPNPILSVSPLTKNRFSLLLDSIRKSLSNPFSFTTTPPLYMLMLGLPLTLKVWVSVPKAIVLSVSPSCIIESAA